jgi:CheY-like chemotaxis protein
MSPAQRFPHDPQRSCRVLIAAEAETTRMAFRDVVGSLHCDVLDAEDGREALVKALVHPPELLIAEMRLPILDGNALCEVLRRDVRTRSVPILLVADEMPATEVERARESGADIILVKPVSPESLLMEIRRLLGRVEPPTPPESTKRRTAQSQSHQRFETKSPPLDPPTLLCPSCDQRLWYERSYVGGVNPHNGEQWDRYRCPRSCGNFEYRQRTKKLRVVGR